MPRLLSNKSVHAHRYIDMWAFPGVHPTNLEFFQRLKMADDRQFGTHMDVCGTVSEKDLDSGKWAKSHILALRTDIWNPDRARKERRLAAVQAERREQLRREVRRTGALSAAQNAKLNKRILRDPVMKLTPGDLDGRRMVLKMFRSAEDLQRIRWVGSMEEVTTAEVHNTLGSRRALLSLSAMLAGREFITELQENHRIFRIPSLFSCCYFDERIKRMWYLSIKRKWISFGADFTLEAEGRRLGYIDGALFGLGYNAHLTVSDPQLAQDTQFLDFLTLFTASVSYHASLRRSVKRRVAASRKGLAGEQLVEDEELSLMKNPRAA